MAKQETVLLFLPDITYASSLSSSTPSLVRWSPHQASNLADVHD